MKDINESIELIRDYYPTNSTFEMSEAEDIFSMLLGDYVERFFLALENSNSPEGRIDLYESLATCVILCGDDFDLKIQFIFELFDFNRNGVIDKPELILSNQAAIRGLCKISDLPFPTLS